MIPAALAVCTALAAGATAAQPLDLDAQRSKVSLELAGTTPASVAGDPASTFSERTVRLRAILQLPASYDTQRTVSLVQPFLTLDLRGARATVPWPSETHDLLRAGLGGGVLLGTAGHDLYLLGGEASWDADRAALSAGAVRGAVYGLGSLRLGQDVRGLYGGVFGYAFGRGLLLPALGVQWRLAPDWKLLALLPFEAKLTWNATDQLRFGVSLSPSGDRAQVANGGAFASAGEALALGTRSVQLALSARLRVSDSIRCEVVGGVRSRGRIFAEDDSGRVLDAAQGAAGFGLVRLEVSFGESAAISL